MKLNKAFNDSMTKSVKSLVDNANFNTATKHVTYDASKVEMPEGVTLDSLKAHTTFINELSGQVETATAQIARDRRAEDDTLTTLDGTLDMGAFTINSQHHLQQKVGDEYIYGQGTTAVDYMHSEEQSLWVQTQRTASQEQAAKLFG